MRKHHQVREGQIVRVIDGPLTGFRGEVKEVNEQTAKVAVQEFGRVRSLFSRLLRGLTLAMANFKARWLTAFPQTASRIRTKLKANLLLREFEWHFFTVESINIENQAVVTIWSHLTRSGARGPRMQ